VALGDEVFIVGLFRHRSGDLRNIPIVRVGNLCSVDEEKISTSLGPMEAMLVEARSIGGLSGSPVFLHLGVTRYLQGQLKHSSGGPMFFLLGLIHGHFDAPTAEIDEIAGDAGLSVERVNTGIAIVIPIERVLEVLEAHRRNTQGEVWIKQ
jgi:hypothetical protein